MYPNNLTLRMYRGLAYADKAMIDKFTQDLAAINRIDPKCYESTILKAVILIASSEYDNAEILLEEVVPKINSHIVKFSALKHLMKIHNKTGNKNGSLQVRFAIDL
jgi:hypothetical protein